MCLSMLEDVSPISSSSPATRVYAQVSSILSAYLRHSLIRTSKELESRGCNRRIAGHTDTSHGSPT